MMLDGTMFTAPLLRCRENQKLSEMMPDGYGYLICYLCHALGKAKPDRTWGTLNLRNIIQGLALC
jgi:hypothetical protein